MPFECSLSDSHKAKFLRSTELKFFRYLRPEISILHKNYLEKNNANTACLSLFGVL